MISLTPPPTLTHTIWAASSNSSSPTSNSPCIDGPDGNYGVGVPLSLRTTRTCSTVSESSNALAPGSTSFSSQSSSLSYTTSTLIMTILFTDPVSLSYNTSTLIKTSLFTDPHFTLSTTLTESEMSVSTSSSASPRPPTATAMPSSTRTSFASRRFIIPWFFLFLMVMLPAFTLASSTLNPATVPANTPIPGAPIPCVFNAPPGSPGCDDPGSSIPDSSQPTPSTMILPLLPSSTPSPVSPSTTANPTTVLSNAPTPGGPIPCSLLVPAGNDSPCDGSVNSGFPTEPSTTFPSRTLLTLSSLSQTTSLIPPTTVATVTNTSTANSASGQATATTAQNAAKSHGHRGITNPIVLLCKCTLGSFLYSRGV